MKDHFFELFTLERVIPHLPILQIELQQQHLSGAIIRNPQKIYTAMLELEQLTYCVGCAFVALHELINLANIIVTDYQTSKRAEHGIHGLDTDERLRLAYKIDNSLEISIRIQNTLYAYLNHSEVFPITVPKDLWAFVNQVKEGKVIARPDLTSILTEYWDKSGEQMRRYRNLFQHHTVVSSDGRIFMTNEGFLALYLALPNNPDVVDISKLSYENPVVLAIPFIHEHFFSLVKMVYRVTDLLLDPSKDRDSTVVNIFHKGNLQLGLPSNQIGHNIFPPDAILIELKQLLDSERERRNATQPKHS